MDINGANLNKDARTTTRLGRYFALAKMMKMRWTIDT